MVELIPISAATSGPLGKQWGYLFGTPSARTLAHELGHGKTMLEHTFYDKTIAQGATRNLMDYSDGDTLVRCQWEYIHDPAIFAPQQDDGDAAGYECLAQTIEEIESGSETYCMVENFKPIFDDVYKNFATYVNLINENSKKPAANKVEEIKKIDEWSVRASALGKSTANMLLYDKALSKIKNAWIDKKVTFTLCDKGIFIGTGYSYHKPIPMAIYSHKKDVAIYKAQTDDYCNLFNDPVLNKKVKVLDFKDYFLLSLVSINFC